MSSRYAASKARLTSCAVSSIHDRPEHVDLRHDHRRRTWAIAASRPSSVLRTPVPSTGEGALDNAVVDHGGAGEVQHGEFVGSRSWGCSFGFEQFGDDGLGEAEARRHPDPGRDGHHADAFGRLCDQEVFRRGGVAPCQRCRRAVRGRTGPPDLRSEQLERSLVLERSDGRAAVVGVTDDQRAVRPAR